MHHKATDDHVLQIVRQRGTAKPADVQRTLGVSRATASRRLARLAMRDSLRRLPGGAYRLAEDVVASDEGREALEAIRRSGVDAHLSGMDVLAHHAHQFTYAFPHLVYAESQAVEILVDEFDEVGLIAQPVRRHRIKIGDVSKLVLVGRQSAEEANRLGVIEGLAPPEKAWIDLWRETRRGRYPADELELGRILGSLLRSGGDQRRLVRMARRWRLDAQLLHALDGDDSALSHGLWT